MITPHTTAPAPQSPGLALAEFDCVCQRCGQRDGSRFVIERDAPAEGFFRTVCARCSDFSEDR